MRSSKQTVWPGSTASGFSAIRCLFFCGSPSAIRWLVSLHVSDTFKSFPLWPPAHIGDKVFEFSPASAYADASTAVTMVVLALLIGASLNHVHPRNICRRPVLSRSMAMFGFPYSCRIGAEAAAAFRLFAAQIRSKDSDFVAARAQASPAREPGIIRCALENTKPAESFADQIVQEHKCRGAL